MRSLRPALALATALAVAAVALPAAVLGQGIGCQSVGDYRPADMDIPNAEGANVTGQLNSPGDRLGVRFTARQSSAASLYVGDQWYDLDLYLYGRGQCPAGQWSGIVRSWSTRSDRRLLQFMRPDEQIVNVAAGDYLLLVQPKEADDPQAPTDFDPSRSFTVRVALNTPYCGLDPPDQPVPHPSIPSITLARRPDDALYQLGLLVDPPNAADRGPFALLTFTAFVSPPYIDLFDFVWQVDGQAQPDVTIGTLQVPAASFPSVAGGQHRVRVTGIGARQYPDPSLTHTPPTLNVECMFQLAGAQGSAGSGGLPAPGPGSVPAPGGGGAPAPASVNPAPPAPQAPPAPPSSAGNPPPAPASPPQPAPAGPAPTAPSYEPDYGLVQLCRAQVGVVGAYSSSQQFDQVVACYVQATVAAGSPLSPAEIEQRIRRALAF